LAISIQMLGSSSNQC